MLEAHEPKQQALIDKIQKFRKESMPEIVKAILSESRGKSSKLLTMIHGDFWNNNIINWESLFIFRSNYTFELYFFIVYDL